VPFASRDQQIAAPQAAQDAADAPVKQKGLRLTRSKNDNRIRAINPVAWSSLAVAIAGLLINLGGLSGLIAVGLGIAGLVRASHLDRTGELVTGKGYAVAGVIIGAVGAILYISLFLRQVIVGVLGG
jgi:hypothetical protein